MQKSKTKKWIVAGVILLLILGIGLFARKLIQNDPLPEGFASGNGRIEAIEIDIATKNPGRVAEILVDEGAWVKTGQVLARMDTEETQSELREAEADQRRAQEGRKYAQAIVRQRESELSLARKELSRSQQLVKEGHISKEVVDQRVSTLRSAEAALQAAKAQVVETEAGIEAAEARVQRLKVRLADSELVAPEEGRVLYRLAEPGEVLAAGGRLLTVLKLTDVYMTIFLPTSQAGRVIVSSEARIILDVRPDLVIPAKVSFVAPRAQFTPKEVETRTEREKLMFRIKVQIDRELVRQHIEKVKTGVPGVAYVRLDQGLDWPDWLRVKLPQ